MKKYEIMFIVKSTLEDEVLKKVVDETKSLIDGKSKITDFQDLGKKTLAYPIKKELSGAYFLMYVEATPEVISEFDRKTLINENILRHLIINKEGE